IDIFQHRLIVGIRKRNILKTQFLLKIAIIDSSGFLYMFFSIDDLEYTFGANYSTLKNIEFICELTNGPVHHTDPHRKGENVQKDVFLRSNRTGEHVSSP